MTDAVLLLLLNLNPGHDYPLYLKTKSHPQIYIQRNIISGLNI